MAVVVVADDANVIVVVVHVAVDGLPTQGLVFSLTIKPLAARRHGLQMNTKSWLTKNIK